MCFKVSGWRAAALALALLLFAWPRAAAASDSSYAAESLLLDIERIVDAREDEGWVVDDQAFDEMREDLLHSICRTPPASRDLALVELERQRARFGDARALYTRAGRELTSDVKRALSAERRALSLRMGIVDASRSCPFWIEPEPDFRGRQIDRDRVSLHLESGGNAQLRVTQGLTTIGAGGLGRALLGYGFSGRFSLLGGIEFGGGAMLKPGVQPTEFVVNYFPALPVVFRIHDVAWHYDIEAAPVALFQADNSTLSFGTRVAGGFGIAVLRTRGFIPWAGGVLGYEYYFRRSERPAAHFLRGGFRVGVVWDP